MQALSLFILIPLLSGCEHPGITAVNLTDPNEPEGVPYYLPKPYLVVSKNIRYMPTPTVGLTQTAPIPNEFDSAAKQAAPAGAGNTNAGGGRGAGATNTAAGGGGRGGAAAAATGGGAGGATGSVAGNGASTNKTANPQAGPPLRSQVLGPASIAVVPPASIPDGLMPETFYTYQILYLPDLTQKYGLRVKGGVGEMRATLNMVNGWMFTGPGPVYFHDSSTAETASAYGTAASGVLESAASFVSSIYGVPAIGGGTAAIARNVPRAEDKSIQDFAELWVYEPVLVNDAAAVGGKRIKWQLLEGGSNPTFSMNRDIASTIAGGGSRGDEAPGITGQATQAIKALDLAGLAALRTAKSGDDYVIVVNRAVTSGEKQALLNKLAGTGVVGFPVESK